MTIVQNNPNHPRHPARRSKWVAGVLLGVASVCATQTIAYPLKIMQGLVYLLLFFSTALGIERCLAACLAAERPLNRWWLRGFLAFALAIGVLHGVDSAAYLHARMLAKDAIDPLSRRIDTAQVLAAHDIAAILPASSPLRQIDVHQGEVAALIEIAAGSLDIDGSTLCFVWPQGSWLRFHNDADATTHAERNRCDALRSATHRHIRCMHRQAVWQCADVALLEPL